MNKKNSKTTQTTARKSKASLRKTKATPRNSTTSPRKPKAALRNSKTSPRKTKTTPRNSKATVRKTKAAPRKPKASPRNSKAALRNSNAALHIPQETALEPAGEPHNRYRPEYLGRPYVLSTNIPNYMPRSEADLMDWIRNYLDVAKTYVDTFPDIFGPEAPFPRQDVGNFRAGLVTARVAAREAEELARAWRAFTRIGLFATEHKQAPPLTAPEITVNLTTVYSWSLTGIVGIIDQQVRALRVHANFNQSIAEHLGIIPRPPTTPDSATANPNPRGRVDGVRVFLNFRSPAPIPGAVAVEIRVDRGDGVLHHLTTTGGSSFIDVHVMPANPTAWTYLFNYVDNRGEILGVTGSVTVIVQAP